MEEGSANPERAVHLSDEAQARIVAALSDIYVSLYEERPGDARASLTGDMLIFVFEDGLTIADDQLLRNGHEERVREFRRQLFEVIGDRLARTVHELTGFPVSHSFSDFDPRARTTRALFVLELDGSPP
jgi:uncharacterized protein YbcI